MKIESTSRPWIKESSHRHNIRTKDSYYQTAHWKNLRAQHRNGSTLMPDGYRLLNIFCYDCYNEEKKIVQGSVCDHDKQRIMGGKDELENLRTRCDPHHNAKSACERNKMYNK